jgi:hypothetical protein
VPVRGDTGVTILRFAFDDVSECRQYLSEVLQRFSGLLGFVPYSDKRVDPSPAAERLNIKHKLTFPPTCTADHPHKKAKQINHAAQESASNK